MGSCRASKLGKCSRSSNAGNRHSGTSVSSMVSSGLLSSICSSTGAGAVTGGSPSSRRTVISKSGVYRFR
eukprot:28920-Amphidinium_carterae.1